MKKIRSNGSRMFLTELMFSIFFFLVVIAICTQLFAESYIMSSKAGELAHATNVASNIAEEFLGTDLEDFTRYYDENWQEVSSDGVYKATGIITEREMILSMSISVSSMDDEEIYALTVEKANRW